MRYENHMLKNERLPFIFHFDIVGREIGACGDLGNWHENPEFLCFTAGEGTLLYNGRSYTVQKGDLAMINPDCIHAVSADERVEYFCLIVDAEFFRENGIPIDTLMYPPYVEQAGLTEDFQRIALLYSEKPPYYCTKIRVEVLRLLLKLTERYAVQGAMREGASEAVKSALLYIRENYDKNITVDDIVHHTGFSRAYFSREFKKTTDVSMITYLNYVRCSQAKALLHRKSVTVSEAAALCGYNNLSYFSKMYQRLMGHLPSEEGRCASVSQNDRMKRLENDVDTGNYMPDVQ